MNWWFVYKKDPQIFCIDTLIFFFVLGRHITRRSLMDSRADYIGESESMSSAKSYNYTWLMIFREDVRWRLRFHHTGHRSLEFVFFQEMYGMMYLTSLTIWSDVASDQFLNDAETRFYLCHSTWKTIVLTWSSSVLVKYATAHSCNDSSSVETYRRVCSASERT